MSMETPSSDADLTAPATVLGMSWYLRSRNTLRPEATRSRTICGPSAVKSCLPTLKVVAASPMDWTIWRACVAPGTSSATISRSWVSIRLNSNPSGSDFNPLREYYCGPKFSATTGVWRTSKRTRSMPFMANIFAAPKDRSMIRLRAIGPRSLMRTNDRNRSKSFKSVTLTQEPSGKCAVCRGKLEHVVRFAACSLLMLKDATIPRGRPDLRLPRWGWLSFLSLSWGPFLRFRCAITGCCAQGGGEKQSRRHRAKYS